MSAHKFRIGQMVTYRPDQRGQEYLARWSLYDNCASSREYRRPVRYRIENLNEQHERVAKEERVQRQISRCSGRDSCIISDDIRP